jgi:hypothetical protein
MKSLHYNKCNHGLECTKWEECRMQGKTINPGVSGFAGDACHASDSPHFPHAGKTRITAKTSKRIGQISQDISGQDEQAESLR